jgi:hypothetical protein
MNHAVLKLFAALIPVCALFTGSAVIWLPRKSISSFLECLGATSLMIVILTHVFEALRLFPSMRRGSQHSVGHYLDLSCAILGVTLFSLGYLIQAVGVRVEKK